MAKLKKAAAKKSPPSTSKKVVKKAAQAVTKYVTKKLPVMRHVNPADKSIFANHVVIRADKGTYQIIFFEIQLPLVLENDPEEWKIEAAKIDHADAFAVARVVIPSHLMPALAQACQTQVDRASGMVIEEIDDDLETKRPAKRKKK